MPAPVSFTQEFGDLLTHTAYKIFEKGMFKDAIYDAYPTLEWMKSGGNIKKVPGGGALIQTGLMYAKANAVHSYEGIEELEIAPSEGFTSAFYDYSQYHGPIMIDGITKFKNAGPERIADLVASKTQQVAMTFADLMNGHLFATTPLSDALRGKNIYSLQSFMQEDPTASLEIGKINQGTYSWWRNLYKDGSSLNTGRLVTDGMRNMVNNLKKTSGGPSKVMICGQGFYEDFEAWLDDRVQYVQTKVGEPGFEKIKFKGHNIWFDDDCPAGTIFFINPNFLHLVVASGFEFKPTAFERPTNQDAYIANCFWYGQLVCSNRRKLGVMFDVPAFTS